MVDILYLACGRPEFTRESLRRLMDTLKPFRTMVRLFFYTDGAIPALDAARDGFMCTYHTEKLGGPVAIMNHYVQRYAGEAEYFAKIDNDVIVPNWWLSQCVSTMTANKKLGILGLEPPLSRTQNPHGSRRVEVAPEDVARGKYAKVSSVGGVFFARTSAFLDAPRLKPYADGRGGFGEWQLARTDLEIGWIVPSLKLFLLDRLPMEPYASLSAKYEESGIQRFWTRYTFDQAYALAGWWFDEKWEES